MELHGTTKLLTPEIVFRDPMRVIDSLPRTFGVAALVAPDECPLPPQSRSAVAVFGKKHRKAITLTVAALATFAEACRYGHTFATNSNFAKPIPKVYVKFCPRDAATDTMPVARIIAAAGPHEAATTLDLANDLRPENLALLGAGKPEKMAIDKVRHHVERLARERQEGGTPLEDDCVDAYLDNFDRLLAVLEMERTGRTTRKDLAELAGIAVSGEDA
ncbi:MAG: hypothetical protein H6878_08740 [Rhodobiaceae bacterium]|nr:hypothetical protein [Rhodobiaceae bacterium]MCC0041341.1 hypothetical protein [Rhodobiaceae bacterium]